MTSCAIVITGAAGGIGSALCERFRQDGFIAIGIDQYPSPAADREFQFDLRDIDKLTDLGRGLTRDFEIKAVVHNAAVQPLAGAGETPHALWTDTLLVNVVAVDALVRGIRPSLSRNEGSVVVIGSVHGRATTAGVAAYATTKAALEGWVRAAALDLGPSIRVNAIAPGAINTAKLNEGFARWGHESAEQRKGILRERTALRRIGDPQDVAGAASFLVGDDARFITGAVLVVDGGATARLGSE